ncbi:hypothetical protein [Mesorhizobium sp.]|uniref:hypothetical protein n=1 Tax=Mesorhizobium sp. TaxID=1871066 RepID=UPI000FE6CEB9|nr:hypothetical protein [Mesorhizobium sp.]RWA58063.1 MAG: hypothetical protein EOQ27_31230 [Mesorhizobium sp.]
MAKRKSNKTIKGGADPLLTTLPPATTSQRHLPLEKVHDEDFEAICVDICEKERGIVRADVKRTRGVGQFGVDVEGFSADQKPALVISCKRYQRIGPANLTEWGTDFLKHLDVHWKGKGVEKFVIAVTVELNDDNLNDRIRTERTRFKTLGLEYEVWGLSQLTSKLRRLSDTVAQYFHPGWVQVIGGATALAATASLPNSIMSPAGSTAAAAASQVLTGATDAIRARYGAEIAGELEDALQHLKSGAVRPLRKLVARIRDDRVAWDALSPETKGKFLRSEGALAIREGDVDTAGEKYRDADAYAPAKDRTPSVLLTRVDSGAEAALQLIADPVTSAEAGLRAGLLIELGHFDEAKTVLDAWPNTSPEDDAFEPLRLRALAQLGNDRREAVDTIARAEQLAPTHYAIHWAGAVIRWNSALSVKVDPTIASFPNPIASGLVRETEDARNALDAAERIFDRLAKTVDTSDQAADLEVWRLSCLILNPSRAAEAAQFTQELLTRETPHAGAVVWATAAGIPFKSDDVVRSINAILKSGTGDVSHAVAVAFVALTRGNKRRALSSLKKWREVFTDPGDRSLLDHWIGMLTEQSDDEATQQFRDSLSLLAKKRDPAALIAKIDGGTLAADMELAAFEALAQAEKFHEINDRRSRLLAMDTAHTVELTIRAAYALGDHQEVIDLARDHAAAFYRSQMPRRLEVLLAHSRMMMGQADLALKALEEMAARDVQSSEAVFQLALMRLRVGDVTGAANVLRGRELPKQSPTPTILKIAVELKREHPDLARRLAENIPWETVNHTLLPQALGLAQELGLRTAADAIMPRLVGPGAEVSGVIVIESVEEAIQFVKDAAARREKAESELTKRWLAAEIPIHLVFDRRPAEMATFFNQPFVSRPILNDNGALDNLPFLARSGHQHPRNEQAAKGRFLCLDITALLLGHELGLLENLEAISDAIRLPHEIPELLRTMETELDARFAPLAGVARDVRNAIEAGRIGSAEFAPDALHLIREDDADVPTPNVTIAGLVAHLVASGMDPDVARNALSQLELAPVATVPNLPEPLILHAQPPDILAMAHAGLFSRMMEHAQFVVAPSSKERFLSDFDHHISGRALADRISVLRQLVATKITSGKWQFLPVSKERIEFEEAGAAVRSFVSFIDSAAGGEGDIWVEDRVISLFGRVGQNRVVNSSVILDRLRAAGRFSEAECIRVEKKLRGAGYGFSLPDAKTIAQVLLEAPIVGDGILETDELTAIRRDFAIQFSNSRHLVDKANGDTPAEGPELLFFSKLMGLTGKVLAELWNREDVDAAHRIAAATWAWRHLRIEQASFLPRENRTLASREYIVFLQYLSIVTAVFNLVRPAFRASREMRTSYLEWAFDTIIDPAIDVHPTFADGIVKHVAKALSGFGQPEKRYPEFSAEVLASVIDDYLRAFPEKWRSRLKRDEAIRELIGLREIERVSIGEGFDFTASQFYEAIANVQRNGKATTPTWNGEKVATFEIVEDAAPTEDTPAGFSVSIGDQVAYFSDDRLELESSDAERRYRSLKRHPEWFDQTGAELDVTARNIADEEDALRRRQLVAQFQDRSMTSRIAKLGDQISKKGSSDKELLFPPSPEAVRQYLRLKGPLDYLSLGWLDRSFAQLSSEYGPLYALRRVGSVPFELGAASNEAIVKGVDDAGLVKAFELAGFTPMVRSAMFAALVSGSRAESEFSELIEPWTSHGELHLALVKLAFRSAASRKEWLEVPAMERAILLWTHANAVLDVLQLEGAEPERTAKLIGALLKENIENVYHRAKTHAGKLLDPVRTTARDLVGMALSYVIGPSDDTNVLRQELREQIRGSVGFLAGDKWVPHLELLIPKTYDEPAGCWFGNDPAQNFAARAIIELPSPFEIRSPRLLAEKLKQRIRDEKSVEGTGYWPLTWMLGVEALDDATSSEFHALLSSDLLPLMDLVDSGMLPGALLYRAELLGAKNDVVGFRSLLESVAAQIQAQPGRNSIVSADFSKKTSATSTFLALAEASWQFAVKNSTHPNECFSLVAEHIGAIADAWPSSLAGCLCLLDNLAAQLPVEPAGPMWDTINRLRAS